MPELPDLLLYTRALLARVVGHPLLRVRRDVTGALRGILGVCGDVSTGIPGEPVADEITESWIHVELGPPRDNVTADQLAAALRHVLDDVRVAVEDQARMGAMARSLAQDLGGEPGSDRAEHGDLLRWLADGNFLFLGYREYDIVQTADGAGLRAVPGSGLGILRHAQPGKESVRKMSSQVARRAQDILNAESIAINGASVLLLGITYKPDIADQRESPAVPLATHLLALGAVLSYHDPLVESWSVVEATRAESLDRVADVDLVILVQAHAAYDVDLLASRARRFFDTRGVTRGPKVHRL